MAESNEPGSEHDDWEVVRRDDPLSGPPASIAGPLVHSAPLVLNVHDLEWKAVEHLIVALAREIDGASEVRLYGRPGQRQDGIDVVARFPANRKRSAYQSRRWTKFTAADLERAVSEFATGKRPFDPKRFVVVTSAEGNDTTVLKKLETLRAQHPDLDIDLWDRHELSRLLRSHPVLVARFFGQATADLFCDGNAAPTKEHNLPVSSDAILRGPVAHLGLARQFAEAVAARDSDPASAASTYGDIAEALERSAYAPHASLMRLQQAAALRAAGDAANAIDVDLRIMAAALASGDPWEALVVAHYLADEACDVPESAVRAVNALGSIASYEHDHAATLDGAAEAFDATKPGDPYRLEAAVLFGEHAIAGRRAELVSDRAEALASVADSAPADDAGRLLAARLRACLADASGDWAALSRASRSDYPSHVAALLYARHGRHLAARGESEAAIDRYYDAIERACQGGRYADAADWLYAIRLVRLRYGPLADDLANFHRLALALRTVGNDSVIPAPFSPRERALSDLHDRKDADALQDLRRYLWRAVVRGAWADEQEAEQRLGQLYAKTGNAAEAIRHLVVAGAVDEVKQIAAILPEAVVRLGIPEEFPSRASWERAAAFACAAAAADLLSDQAAQQWATAALAEIVAQRPAPLWRPHPTLTAYTAFGALADAATADQARAFLDFASSFINRKENEYRHTDDAHAEALVRIARSQPTLQANAVEQMCRALVADDRMGQIILSRGADVLRAHRAVVESICAGPAASGNQRAAVALLLAEADKALVAGLARQLLHAATRPRVHQPGRWPIGGGWGTTASLASALTSSECAQLADACSGVAGDRNEIALNRLDALEALSAVAHHLDDTNRDHHFTLAIEAARGVLDGSAGDDISSKSGLDRFRLLLGPNTLRYSGLRAAAALARTRSQYGQIAEIAQQLIPHSDEDSSNAIAAALALIPGETVGLEASALAAHGSVWIRALAAAMWCRSDGQPPELGMRLATDPSPHVRETLAAHLLGGPAYDEVRAALRKDVRGSVRSALTRRDG